MKIFNNVKIPAMNVSVENLVDSAMPNLDVTDIFDDITDDEKNIALEELKEIGIDLTDKIDYDEKWETE